MSNKWSSLETFTLLAGIRRGYTQQQLADVLHRTSKAVECKVWRIKQTVVRTPMSVLLERLSF